MAERKASKEERRSQILNVAQELFISKGLAETTMSDIADKVKISRRTLYRYYKTKEELAFEIEIRLYEEFSNYQKKIFSSLQGKGIDKIQQFFDNILDYINENINMIKFTGEFDHYFRGEYPYSNLTERFKKMISSNDDLLEKLIKEGIEDGSIRSDLEPRLTALTINNVLLSITQRIMIRGEHLVEEQGIEVKDIIPQQFKIFLLALKNS